MQQPINICMTHILTLETNIGPISIKLLDFPVEYANPEIFKFITEDPNAKYVKYVDKYWLDEQVWHGVQSKHARGIE